MKHLIVFWQFSRPHTIIGSFCSITALYLMALQGQPVWQHIGLYGTTLLSALACNLFIVGLNQWVDVALDKINKPWLPLAAGTLRKPVALAIIYTALAISLAATALTGWRLLALITVIIVIGILYSVPPFQLKKHHVPAAICISLVRGVLVNVGMLWHFTYAVFGAGGALPDGMWPLTVFVSAFSVAIAWYKDLPDTIGDAVFRIRTFPLLYNRRVALFTGAALVLAAYCYCIGWAWHRSAFLLWSHIALLLLFLGNLFTVRLERPASIKGFYLRFWVFFFAEYGVWGALGVMGYE
jgi:homogentisate phytyltransferase / homogentisate geranylgeranyltransferase